jgi:hypothetical protein
MKGETVTDVQDAIIPAGMHQIKLPVKQGNLIFQGRLLGDEPPGVDNDTGDRLRWAQLVAYKGFGVNEDSPETFGREYYLLYAIGHSLAVHSADGCRGFLAPVRKFSLLNEDSEDLEPCPNCHPDFSPASSPDAEYKLEVTRYSHTQYLSAAELVDALCKCRSCSHRPHDGRPCSCGCRHYVKGELSQIGQRLMDKIRDDDEDIDAALPTEVRL